MAFDTISKSDLILKSECEAILKRINKNHFKDCTGATTCSSLLKDTIYAQKKAEVFEGKIISWVPDFDPEGNHVWGADNGDYILNKLD